MSGPASVTSLMLDNEDDGLMKPSEEKGKQVKKDETSFSSERLQSYLTSLSADEFSMREGMTWNDCLERQSSSLISLEHFLGSVSIMFEAQGIVPHTVPMMQHNISRIPDLLTVIPSEKISTLKKILMASYDDTSLYENEEYVGNQMSKLGSSAEVVKNLVQNSDAGRKLLQNREKLGTVTMSKEEVLSKKQNINRFNALIDEISLQVRHDIQKPLVEKSDIKNHIIRPNPNRHDMKFRRLPDQEQLDQDPIYYLNNWKNVIQDEMTSSQSEMMNMIEQHKKLTNYLNTIYGSTSRAANL